MPTRTFSSASSWPGGNIRSGPLFSQTGLVAYGDTLQGSRSTLDTNLDIQVGWTPFVHPGTSSVGIALHRRGTIGSLWFLIWRRRRLWGGTLCKCAEIACLSTSTTRRTQDSPSHDGIHEGFISYLCWVREDFMWLRSTESSTYLGQSHYLTTHPLWTAFDLIVTDAK